MAGSCSAFDPRYWGECASILARADPAFEPIVLWNSNEAEGCLLSVMLGPSFETRNETDMNVDPRDRHTILAHYYRAMVGRADIWRMRMDATTNWAIGATAAVISFAFGNASTPHFVVYIAVLLTLSFLFLEARRLTFYHLWQHRVLLLEKGLIRSAVAVDSGDGAADFDLETALGEHLGRTVPSMPISKAVARRLRRIYLYLFGVQLLAWVLKLSSQGPAIDSFAELVSRADVGGIPGEVFFGASCLGYLGAIVFALRFGGINREKNQLTD